jgi:hypothetical protein
MYSPLIAKEIEDMSNEKAPIQNAIRGILAREECLKHVKEMN